MSRCWLYLPKLRTKRLAGCLKKLRTQEGYWSCKKRRRPGTMKGWNKTLIISAAFTLQGHLKFDDVAFSRTCEAERQGMSEPSIFRWQSLWQVSDSCGIYLHIRGLTQIWDHLIPDTFFFPVYMFIKHIWSVPTKLNWVAFYTRQCKGRKRKIRQGAG